MTTVKYSIEESIAFITIDRPKALNALNAEVFDDLDNILDQLAENKDVRVAIITGAGEKAFAAGADITQFGALDAERGTQLSLRGQKVFRRIELNRIPFIAAVNGFALGGGCELTMACHIRIASEHAKFGQPEVNLGLIPGYGGSQRLVQIVGKGRALDLLLTARMIDAKEALNYGLVTQVTAASELLEAAKKTALKITSKGPMALAETIQVVDANFTSIDGFELEAERFGHCMASSECKEGVSAFLEKRKPEF